jgi:hypothetical protein
MQPRLKLESGLHFCYLKAIVGAYDEYAFFWVKNCHTSLGPGSSVRHNLLRL